MTVKATENSTPPESTISRADAVNVTNDQGDNLRITARGNGEFIIRIPAGFAIVPTVAGIELVRYLD